MGKKSQWRKSLLKHLPDLIISNLAMSYDTATYLAKFLIISYLPAFKNKVNLSLMTQQIIKNEYGKMRKSLIAD